MNLPLRPLKFVCASVRVHLTYRAWFAGLAYYFEVFTSDVQKYFDFRLVFWEYCVGFFILGVTNNPPSEGI